MKKWKISIVIILSIIDAYLMYSWIGYLVLGTRHPHIVGETNTNFMGMYMMSITFFVLFAILSTIIIILCVKFFKKNK